jgi:hypothetical protein
MGNGQYKQVPLHGRVTRKNPVVASAERAPHLSMRILCHDASHLTQSPIQV